MSGASDVVLLARVTGSLVVVLLVAVLAARLARRANGRRGRTGSLQVLERVGLGRETCAVVLEVGDRILLLGVSPQQVAVLAELGPSGVIQAITSGADATPPPHVAAADANAAVAGVIPVPAQRSGVRVLRADEPQTPLTRRAIREAATVRQSPGRRRPAVPPTQRGTGSALDPRTWQQGLEALRDLTARRR